MRVLVTFAVEAEFAPWRKRWPFEVVEVGSLRFWRAAIDNFNVAVLLTGMRTESAVLAVDSFMRLENKDRSFDVCISSGLAGALIETLTPGDIIAPLMLVPETAHPTLEINQQGVDAELRELAIRYGAKGIECLYTADQVLVKSAEKTAHASRGDAVDMESFGIVTEAKAWGVRAVVIRAISDSASEDLPLDFNQTLSDTEQISVPRVLMELAKRPMVLPALVRFGNQSRRAAESLANFLDRYFHEFGKLTTLGNSNQVAAR